jgi:hypothetical protein
MMPTTTTAGSRSLPCVNGHLELPVGGRWLCPLVADKNCPVADTNLPLRRWPPPVRVGLSGQGFDSFPVECLGQSYGVSAGLAEVGVVE